MSINSSALSVVNARITEVDKLIAKSKPEPKWRKILLGPFRAIGRFFKYLYVGFWQDIKDWKQLFSFKKASVKS